MHHTFYVNGQKERAKFLGSCAMVGMLGLVPSCHRAFLGPKAFFMGFSWVRNVLSFLYFIGDPNFFTWVFRKSNFFFSWVSCGFIFFPFSLFRRFKFFSFGYFLDPNFFTWIFCGLEMPHSCPNKYRITYT